jgi:hypothetical protein
VNSKDIFTRAIFEFVRKFSGSSSLGKILLVLCRVQCKINCNICICIGLAFRHTVSTKTEL